MPSLSAWFNPGRIGVLRNSNVALHEAIETHIRGGQKLHKLWSDRMFLNQ
jgi:hypothetical protein